MNFSELNLHPKIVAAIDKLGFESCTPIQEKTIPHLLNGSDVAGLAQTGTGKTAAFLLPMIHRVLLSQEKGQDQIESSDKSTPANSEEASEKVSEEVGESAGEDSRDASAGSESATPDGDASAVAAESEKKVINSQLPFENWRELEFVLVLVPTRELAEQALESFKKFSLDTGLRAVSVYGGTSYDKQKASFERGVQFVFATPGRLIDLYKEKVIDFRLVRAVVFDEADRMFDMGFKDDMRYVLRRIPETRQILLFSATLNLDVLNIAYEFGANPVEIDVSRDQLTADNVTDEIFHVGQKEKPTHLLALLKKRAAQQVIIFSNFKANIGRIEQFLNDNGFPALGISSVLTQNQRNRVMKKFKEDSGSNILVATDVAARGLDIKGVDLVVNFELPNDAENYVHRIGRTGRAGQKGVALSLVSDMDVDALGRIEEYLQRKIEIGWLDDKDLSIEHTDFPRHDDRMGRGKSDRGGQKSKGGKGGKYGQSKGGPSGGKKKRSHKPGEKSEHRDRATNRHRQQGAMFEGEAVANHSGSKKKRRSNNKKRRPSNKNGASNRPDSRTAKKSATPAQPAGIMQKVSGFFKNLFGGGGK